jgi:hypothetical protein
MVGKMAASTAQTKVVCWAVRSVAESVQPWAVRWAGSWAHRMAVKLGHRWAALSAVLMAVWKDEPLVA